MILSHIQFVLPKQREVSVIISTHWIIDSILDNWDKISVMFLTLATLITSIVDSVENCTNWTQDFARGGSAEIDANFKSVSEIQHDVLEQKMRINLCNFRLNRQYMAKGMERGIVSTTNTHTIPYQIPISKANAPISGIYARAGKNKKM